MPHDPLDNVSTAGADTPQRKLGKYLLQRLLGRGGMGEVWLARDTLADIEVALKMLPPELRHSEEAQDQIRSSYQRVHRLGHPHICAVKDLVTDPGTGYFLVMDYFEGVTLSKYRAKQGGMTVAEVVRLLTPVAQALDYAHSLKLAHRDIKPGNILVSEDGQQVRVIDFQLASDIRASVSRLPNAPVNTSGTYPYMAPEQFLGQRASAQTDLYALAMVAYELLDGQLPYEADSWDQWKSIVTDERSVLPTINDIPPEAQLALEAGLSRDKFRWAGTCSQWVQSLDPIMTGKLGYRVPMPLSVEPQIVVSESPRAPASMKAPFSADEARAGQEAWATFLSQSVIETNSIGMELR